MSLDQQAPIAAVFDANRCNVGLIVMRKRSSCGNRTVPTTALA
jgi:hypothetical protein